MIACPCHACTSWALEETGTAGEPWRPVPAGVTRWARLRVRNREEDRDALMVAEVEEGPAADLLRAAEWYP
jgi:hypothetical protein